VPRQSVDAGQGGFGEGGWGRKGRGES